MGLEWSPTLHVPRAASELTQGEGLTLSSAKATEGLAFLPGLHPNAEVENNIFLLEVSGSSVNHCAVTADPNTSSGWVSDEEARSNQSIGKGNPKRNGQGIFFHTAVAHGAAFPQINRVFQSNSPEVH